jgi:hypothetical protein
LLAQSKASPGLESTLLIVYRTCNDSDAAEYFHA